MRDKKIISFLSNESFKSIVAALITVVLGMVVGLVILIMVSPSTAGAAFVTLVTGGFKGTGLLAGLGSTIYYAVPIIFTGLAIAFAFKTGIFNMGVPGSYTMGAVFAIITAIYIEPHVGRVSWVIAVIVAVVLGAVWALVPALLKAFCNANPVITGIMMNYVALFLVNWIIKGDPNLYEKSRNWTASVPDGAIVVRCGLDKLFAGKPVNIGIIIAIIAAIVIWYVLNRTVLGYEMVACGLNRDASEYAGISVKRTIIISMMISGALAGLGGGLYFLTATGTHYNVVDVVLAEGMTGIAVAMLGMLHPVGIIFSGTFIAFLEVGGLNMQAYGLEPEIVDVITSVIIFACAFAFVFKNFYGQIFKRREQ